MTTTITETIATTTVTQATKVSESASATAEATAEAVESVVKISIKTPIIYVSILIITLVVFSIYHRKAKINGLRSLTNESLFTSTHLDYIPDAEIAMTLPTPDSTPAAIFKQLQGKDVSDKMMKVALVARAAESLRRIVKLKETEQTMMILYTRGLVGDDTFKRYQLQVKLQDAEMQDIAMTAERISKGWAQSLFASAQDVMMNQALRRRLAGVSDRVQQSNDLLVTGIDSVVTDMQGKIQQFKQAELVAA